MRPLFLSLLLLFGASLPAQEVASDTNGELGTDIIVTLQERLKSTAIGTLAKARAGKPPGNSHAAAEDFCIFVLAGYDKRLEALFPILQKLEPQLSFRDLELLGVELTSRERWDLVQKFLEAGFQIEYEYVPWVLIEHWKKSKPTEEIDGWLAEREKTEASFAAFRFQLARETHRLPALISSYKERLEKNPGDTLSAYTLAQNYAYVAGDAPPIDWMAETVKFPDASPYSAVGSMCARSAPNLAIRFLEEALRHPYTEKDRKSDEEFYKKYPLGKPEGAYEKIFRRQVQESLVTALQFSGNDEEAGKLQAKLNAEEPLYPDLTFTPLPNEPSSFPATQGPKNAETARWKEQGDTILSAGDTPMAVAAYRKALNAASPDSARGEANNPAGPERMALAASILSSLKNAQADREALNLFMNEVAYHPPESQSAVDLAESAERYHQPPAAPLDPGAPVLWNILDKNANWGDGAGRILSALVLSAPDAQRAAIWSRAEALAANNPARCALLGQVEYQHGEASRAVPLFRSACNFLPAGDERNEAAKDYFQASAEAGYLTEAEEALSGVKFRYLSDRLRALEKLALLHAAAGDKANALRLWSVILDHDRAYESGRDELIKAGWRSDLIAIYRKIAESEPDCTVAVETFQNLESGGNK